MLTFHSLRIEILQAAVEAALSLTAYMGRRLPWEYSSQVQTTFYRLPPPQWWAEADAGGITLRPSNEGIILEVVPPLRLRPPRRQTLAAYVAPAQPAQTGDDQPSAAYSPADLPDPDLTGLISITLSEIERYSLAEYHRNLIRAFLHQLRQDPVLQDVNVQPSPAAANWLYSIYLAQPVTTPAQPPESDLMTPSDLPVSPTPSAEPWTQIPDRDYDRRLLELWHAQEDVKVIKNTIGISLDRVYNRISELRSLHGPGIVPYRRRPSSK